MVPWGPLLQVTFCDEEVGFQGTGALTRTGGRWVCFGLWSALNFLPGTHAAALNPRTAHCTVLSVPKPVQTGLTCCLTACPNRKCALVGYFLVSARPPFVGCHLCLHRAPKVGSGSVCPQAHVGDTPCRGRAEGLPPWSQGGGAWSDPDLPPPSLVA